MQHYTKQKIQAEIALRFLKIELKWRAITIYSHSGFDHITRDITLTYPPKKEP